LTQAEAASLAPPATSPPDDERPDWSSVTETIRCPLCAYELRGLVEPRCPECGFAFHWPDLLDPTRRKHPYLFEHHPRSNVWSFFRTMLGNFGPVRFWSSLKPSQPSRPGRLVLYWLIASLLLPVGYAGFFVYTAVRHAKEHEAYRARYATWVTQNLGQFTDAGVIASIQAAGGPRAWVDVEIPPTRSPRYLLYFYHSKFEQHVYPNGEPGQHLEVFLVLIAWPWLTLATLLIFQASMRRAKVRMLHVLRCTLHCCDAALWLGVMAMLAVPWAMAELDLGRYIGFRDAAAAAPLFALVMAWRLSAAYRHYLRFDHPMATAAASQSL